MVTLQVYRKLETYLNDGLLEVDSRLERHEGEREGEIWFFGRTSCNRSEDGLLQDLIKS